jgi:hypothetical protein
MYFVSIKISQMMEIVKSNIGCMSQQRMEEKNWCKLHQTKCLLTFPRAIVSLWSSMECINIFLNFIMYILSLERKLVNFIFTKH